MPKSGSSQFLKKLYPLTIGGGLVFWATTVATSLLPLAAEYRASFLDRSWNIQSVWVGSVFAGVVMAGSASYVFLRMVDRAPTKHPIRLSVGIGLAALIAATILIDVPRSYLASSDGWYYGLIGLLLNGPRFLLLGVVIGYLYQRLYGTAKLTADMAGQPNTQSH